MTKSNKTPFVRINKRNNLNFGKKFLIKASCFAIAIILSLLFLFLISFKNPGDIIRYLVEGSFQVNRKGLNMTKLWSFLQDFIILLAIALALTPCYKMKFWNIGAQGQILIGALATATCMIYLYNLPSWLVILLSIVTGFISGGIWALIPAIFKARWNTNETLFTLMMNYIAILLVALCTNIWRGDAGALRTINSASEVGWFPVLLKQPVLIPLILTICLVLTTFVYIKYTKHGYEVEVVGDSIETAKYVGINVRHVIRRTAFLSGAICGLVGFFYVSNYNHNIAASTGGTFGFTAIIVCWLANFNPFVMIGYSALLIFLDKGARNLSNVNLSNNLNEYSTSVAIFLIVIAILIGEFLTRYELVFRQNTKKYLSYLTRGLSVKEGE